MEAIISTGGKQYKVKTGQKIQVELLQAAENSAVEFQTIALVDGDVLKIPAPASVQAKVLRHLRGEKVISATYKRRKGFHKKKGHRQELTEVQITKVN